jgi:predicted O-linked N-acetylglucosamine transferase (SPINDLY family)
MVTISKKLDIAIEHHRAGRLEQAEQLYQEILVNNPRHADALHLLGLVWHQLGKHEIGIESILRALELQPRSAAFLANLGAAYCATKRFDEAVDCCWRALEIEPEHLGAHANMAPALIAQGKLPQAVARYRRAFERKPQPDFGQVYALLGEVFQAQGRIDRAVDSYRRALQIKPGLAETHNNLGTALNTQGELDQAVACYQRALQIKPELAEAHNNLGNVLKTIQKLDEAVASYRRALSIRPDYAEAHNNLGMALSAQGDLNQAISCYQRALQIKPELAEAHNNLGNALQTLRKLDEAAASYRRALSIKPDYADAYCNLGDTLKAQGKAAEAAAAYKRSLEIRPNDRVRFAEASVLPVIYQSNEEIEIYRNRFAQKITCLLDDGVQLDPIRQPVAPPFLLAYQGKNNRALLEMVGQLFVRPSCDLSQRRKAGDKANGVIKIGIISAYFRNHTVGEVWRGLIANLARDKFSITVLSITPSFTDKADSTTEFIRAHCDRFVRLPRHPAIAQRTIGEEELDVLFYVDLGMDSMTYALATSRLAPVQCVTWGHPVTSGLKTIDYFISSELLEANDADQYYTEKLVRLKSLGVYYYRPKRPVSQKVRGDFGLPSDGHLYACLQNLFKFHPNFDSLLAEILQTDPQGRLVIPAGQSANWTEALLSRFRTSLGGLVDRVIVIPRQQYDDFLRLNALVDVLLLPPDFGGGRTSYEAFSLGLPVVTLPSPLLAGRITYALYRKMGVLDCVAQTPKQYVEIAVRLGTDREYREAVREKISASSDALFEDLEAVRELEDFLQRAITEQS